ncbi:Kelch repeat-containing protein [Citrifermentans bremense]|uniref:Kelch repeat-containing protein n=1 Tax=Citrifermentans bremense TaxID=60035 RepID=UPI00040D20EC|nr:kelch repeat-containing protein [Citrifermentans bremense]
MNEMAAQQKLQPRCNVVNPKYRMSLFTLFCIAIVAVASTARAANWSAAGSLATARSYHTDTLLLSGKVLVVGGAGFLANAELYDPASDSWSEAGSIANGRYDHTATLLPSGKVLVAGGGDGSGVLASAELYDPVSNNWSAAGSLTTGVSGHTATLLSNGKVLVVGGYDGNGTFTGIAGAELYDPANDRWSVAASLSYGREGHTATLLPNGKVLVAGGRGQLTSAELYDPASDSWSAAGNMTIARTFPRATLLPNGKVLVVGGSPGGGGRNAPYIASSELYDPSTNSWSAAGSMNFVRANFTATLLPSGQVLVVGGGFGDVEAFASTELYDPVSDSWSEDSSLINGRYYHTATLLPSGKVLVAGGLYSGVPLNSAELYAFTVTTSAINGTITKSGTAAAGGSFTVTMAPDNHYKLYRLRVGGVDVTSKVSNNSYTLTNIMADVAVQATFAPIYLSLTASAMPTEGGRVGTNGTSVVEGNNYFVNVLPNAGYRVTSATVDGTSDVLSEVVANGGYNFKNVTSNHNLAVTFGLIPAFTITATAGAGGSISPTQSAVQPGWSVVYNFTPAAGYAISNVKVDGISVGTPTFYTFINVTANHTIEVTFASSLTLTTSGTNGIISINGIPSTGSVSVAAGSSPVVNVAPNAHYQLYRLMVGTANVTSKVVGGNYSISNILANTAVSATFTPIYWSISGSAGTGGKVSVGSILVQDGSNYYVSITPTKGYKIADVTDNGVSVVGQISGGGYNILNITGSHTIIAIFVLI